MFYQFEIFNHSILIINYMGLLKKKEKCFDFRSGEMFGSIIVLNN